VRAPATFPDPIDGYVEQAAKAFAAARTLPELKAARLEHAGDRSPVSLALRGIGELLPGDRSETAKRLGWARSAIVSAARRRENELDPR
jgi:phenylalanyl-tRNA synthetase alpha chain